MKLKEWINKNYKNLIIGAFLIPIITVALVSISHVTQWYELSNPPSWALYLSVGIEIAAMSALGAIAAKMGKRALFPFIIVTFIQLIGNIYFSYSYIDINSTMFKSWVELVSPVFQITGVDPTDLVAHKRILSFFAGGLLPLISLTFLSMLIKFTEEDRLRDLNKEKEVPKLPEEPIAPEPEPLVPKNEPDDELDDEMNELVALQDPIAEPIKKQKRIPEMVDRGLSDEEIVKLRDFIMKDVNPVISEPSLETEEVITEPIVEPEVVEPVISGNPLSEEVIIPPMSDEEFNRIWDESEEFLIKEPTEEEPIVENSELSKPVPDTEFDSETDPAALAVYDLVDGSVLDQIDPPSPIEDEEAKKKTLLESPAVVEEVPSLVEGPELSDSLPINEPFSESDDDNPLEIVYELDDEPDEVIPEHRHSPIAKENLLNPIVRKTFTRNVRNSQRRHS